MLRIWLSFQRWLRSLAIAFVRRQPINWLEKINELTKIANEALDQYKKPSQGSSLRTRPIRPTRKRRFRR